MNKIATFIFLLLLSSNLLFSQVAINADGSAPDASAGLDVSYSNKGVLIPRMTQAQIAAIPNLTNGLIVFCSSDDKLYVYVGSASAWKEILYGPEIITPACGFSITINHVAGDVSPVTKTTNYNTVTNIPGEPTKCWITQNLGSDHQANAVNDAAESSAGWYWQFNRKQGYKHDGTTRTPDTPWIGNINEDSDWLATSDPCALELGSGWHIPTYTEWYNVDISGDWNDWNDAYNSALKMHAAGELNCYTGSMTLKGFYGYYWSGTQQVEHYVGWYLYFSSINSDMGDNFKMYGLSVRCVKD